MVSGDFLAILLRNSLALLYGDIVTHLAWLAVAGHDGDVDALLVGGGVAVGLLDFYTLFLRYRVTHLAGDLTGCTVAVGLWYRHAELLRGWVTLSMGDRVAFFTRFWVAVFVINWLAVPSWLRMWDVDTFLTRD